MINFIWIVLIVIVASIISTALVVFALYLFYDTIYAFILKRKIPKDRSKFLDGGKDVPQDKKEVNKDDGEFREFDKLRAIAIRERATKNESNSPRFFSNESRDAKINTIANEFADTTDRNSKPGREDTNPVTRRDEEEW